MKKRNFMFPALNVLFFLNAKMKNVNRKKLKYIITNMKERDRGQIDLNKKIVNENTLSKDNLAVLCVRNEMGQWQ